MATIFRGPLIFKTWHKQPWAVSVGSQSWVWQDPQVLKLKGQDSIWGARGMVPDYDWTPPVRPKDSRVAVSGQSWVWEERNTGLLKGQDIIWGPRGMVPDYDWNIPVKQKDARVSLSSQSLVWQERNTGLYVGKDSLPFSQDDWPNPVQPKSRLAAIEAQIRALQNILVGPLYATTLDYILSPPLIFRNWRQDPNASIRAETEVWQNRLLTVLSGQDQLPSNQDDWPNPLRPGPRQAESKGDLLTTLLVGQDQLPIRQEEWPLPQRSGPRQSESKGDLLLTTLLGQDQLPYNQDDWPNPLRPGPRQAESKSDILLTTLVGQDQLPYNQDDWPLPNRTKGAEGASIRSEGEVWQDRLLNLLVGKDQLPFSQDEWPNPQLKRATQQAIDLALTPLLRTPTANPFFGFGFPMPRSPARSQVSLGFSENSVLPTPPVATDTPWAGMISNTGRMMVRRG